MFLHVFSSSRYNDAFLDESINDTNSFYGALHPKTTNVIYVHGSIDPWHALGLTQTTDPALPTIYIEGNIYFKNY